MRETGKIFKTKKTTFRFNPHKTNIKKYITKRELIVRVKLKKTRQLKRRKSLSKKRKKSK